MKKIILLFILVSVLSCKKEWFDYTNKYTGGFEFTVESTYFDKSKGIYDYKKNVYNGTIKRVKRGRIKITFGSGANDFYDVEISKKGGISEGGLSGEFSDQDNLKIYFSSGGLGGGSSRNITGVRR